MGAETRLVYGVGERVKEKGYLIVLVRFDRCAGKPELM